MSNDTIDVIHNETTRAKENLEILIKPIDSNILNPEKDDQKRRGKKVRSENKEKNENTLNRRRFLKIFGLGAASVALGSSLEACSDDSNTSSNTKSDTTNVKDSETITMSKEEKMLLMDDTNIEVGRIKMEFTKLNQKYKSEEDFKKDKLMIIGEPTISQEQFIKSLTKRNPNITNGAEIYSMFKEVNINPSVALGLFIHESSCGTQGTAKQTNSWGNIRYSNPEKVKSDYLNHPELKKYVDFEKEEFEDYYDPGNKGDWRKYKSFLNGAVDWAVLILEKYNTDSDGKPPINTVDDLIDLYAPASDNNDVKKYIESIKEFVWEASDLSN